MAYSSGNNKSPVSLLIIFATALLVVAAITPSANATTLSTIASLTVTGSVCCTATGTCGAPPLVGATVNLVCTDILGNTVTVATTTTSATGTFTLTVAGGLTSPFPNVLYLTCRARVTLPAPGCTLVTTGAYQAPIVVTPNPSPFPFFNFFNFLQPVSATANAFTAVP